MRVTAKDAARAFLRLGNEAQGWMAIPHSARGRMSPLGLGVQGVSAMIIFDPEQMNDVKPGQNRGTMARKGFRAILTGPAHPPPCVLCPAPWHQFGFNDPKTNKPAGFLRAKAGGSKGALPDFTDAVVIKRIIHATAETARERRRMVLDHGTQNP